MPPGPDKAPKLAEIGYTTTEISGKLQDIATLEALNDAQDKGEQYNATATYSATEDALHITYIKI